MPIFAHPRFGPLKKPVFCLRSKFLGMLPTCFFVFFYIDFVFFFMIFAYFPHFLSNFLLAPNAYWQISGVLTSIISELAKVQSPNKIWKSVAICKAFALCLSFILRPAIFNSAMHRWPLVQGVWQAPRHRQVRYQSNVEALMNKTSGLFIYFW